MYFIENTRRIPETTETTELLIVRQIFYKMENNTMLRGMRSILAFAFLFQTYQKH